MTVLTSYDPNQLIKVENKKHKFFRLELLENLRPYKKIQPKYTYFCPICNNNQLFYRPYQVRPYWVDKSFCSVCGWLPGHREKVSDRLKKKVFEADNYECVYCGTGSHLTLEHIIPHSQGGNFKENNLLSACKSCNSSRCNRQAPTPLYGRFRDATSN